VADGSVGELFFTYLREATPFALLHAVLLAACVVIWVREAKTILGARRELDLVKVGGNPAKGTALGLAFDYSIGLATKGRLVEPASIRLYLTSLWFAADRGFQWCVNAFLVSGILGTLYNLWRLRPTLTGLMSGTSVPVLPAGGVGVAFAASIFGLALALGVGLLDVAVFQRLRDSVLEDAVRWLVNQAVERTPPSAEAMLAQAMNDLRDFNGQIIRGVAANLETIAKEFASRFGDLATAATGQIKTSGEQWQAAVRQGSAALDGAATRVSTLGDRVDAQRLQMGSVLDDIVKKQALIVDSTDSVRTSVAAFLASAQSTLAGATGEWSTAATKHLSENRTLHKETSDLVVRETKNVAAFSETLKSTVARANDVAKSVQGVPDRVSELLRAFAANRGAGPARDAQWRDAGRDPGAPTAGPATEPARWWNLRAFWRRGVR
jgi:hypothetical protein